jgi:hypothetical protein
MTEKILLAFISGTIIGWTIGSFIVLLILFNHW